MATVLILEDEPVIADYLVVCLEELGHRALGPATKCDQALQIMERTKPDLALLDASLAGETCEAVLRECQRIHVPVIVSTGMLEAPTFCEGLPILSKPYSAETLQNAVAALAHP